MTAAIVGLGLVSPGGTTAEEHVFFLRAGLLAPGPSPFLDAEDERIDVRPCPWLDPRADFSARLAALAGSAAAGAIEGATRALEGERLPVLLSMEAPRPGLSAEQIAAVAASLAARPGIGEVTVSAGAASAFGALASAAESIEAGRAQAALVLAVDSHLALDFVRHHVERPPSPWLLRSPPPSEGAAAVLLMSAARAKRGATEPIGRLHGAAVERGAATDEDDEPTLGAAMTSILRSVPAPDRFGMAFGPHDVDMLRMRDWHLGSARNAARFADPCAFESLESHVGRLGAAAGLANLVWGLEMLRRDAQREEAWRRLPLCAWALSRDGTRGIASAGWEAR